MVKFTLKLLLSPLLKILTYLLYALTLLTAYGGYLNPEWWTLPALGLLFFPYFAMTTLVVAAGWLIARRFIIGSIGIAVLLGCGPTFTQALPLRFRNYATNESDTFKMVTFNTLHMADLHNPDSTSNFSRPLHFLIHSGADFVCMQEIFSFQRPDIYPRYFAQIDSLMSVYPYISTDDNKEVEFISKYPFEYVPVVLGNDIKYGNVGAYRMVIDGHPLTVINVHLSSYMLSEEERQIFTEAKSQTGVKKSLKEFEGSVYSKMREAFKQRAKVSEAIAEFAADEVGNVIVCGDFNDVPGSWAYRNFTKRGFEDAYAQTGFGHLITYNQHLMYFHIDQILYRGNLVPLYVKKIGLDASDHYPLMAEFEFLQE